MGGNGAVFSAAAVTSTGGSALPGPMRYDASYITFEGVELDVRRFTRIHGSHAVHSLLNPCRNISHRIEGAYVERLHLTPGRDRFAAKLSQDRRRRPAVLNASAVARLSKGHATPEMLNSLERT